MLFPVDPSLRGLELLVDVLEDTELAVELWETGRAENYVPAGLVARATANVRQGERQWVPFGLEWEPDSPRNAFVIIRNNAMVRLYRSAEPYTGVLAFERGALPHAATELEDHDPTQPVVEWSMKALNRSPFCFRAVSRTAAYAPDKTVGGYKRPYGGPNLWVSQPLGEGGEEWLELSWVKPVTIGEIIVTWNDDVNEDLINLHRHRTSFDVIPELAKNYRIEAKAQGEWTVVASVRDNRRRTDRRKPERPLIADALRIVVEETNGALCAELTEVRVYA